MRNLPVEFHKEKYFGVEADFLHGSFATTVPQADGFTCTHLAGAVATGDTFAGGALITSTAGAVEFNTILSTNEIFEFVPAKPIRFLALGVLPILLPNENNIFIGCMEDMDTATEVQAAGAGPRADSDMFGFYTPDDTALAAYVATSDYWHAVSSFGALQQVTALTLANPLNLSGVAQKAQEAGVGVEHDLLAEWVPTNVVPGVAGAAPTLMDAEVRFWIDGILACKHQMRGAFQITIGTTEEMNFGVVTANITDICSMSVDYIKCEQVR